MSTSQKKPIILFLCTGNTARSQMAEALLRRRAGDRFDVRSAGLHPGSEVNPYALRVLEEVGIDTAGMHPKGTDKFLGHVTAAYAIVVCEKTQEDCPQLFPFAKNCRTWPFDDPAAFEGSEAATLEKFRDARDRIDARITQWLREEGDE